MSRAPLRPQSAPSFLSARRPAKALYPTLAACGLAIAVAAGLASMTFVKDRPDTMETAAVVAPKPATTPKTEAPRKEVVKPPATASTEKPMAASDTRSVVSPQPMPQPVSAAAMIVEAPSHDTLPVQAFRAPEAMADPAPFDEGLRGSIDVQVAENEEQVAALETSTGMTAETSPLAERVMPEDTSAPADNKALQPAPEAETSATQAAAPAVQPSGTLPPMKAAKTTQHVKMRAGPADEAGVITVVPANTALQAEADCNWCTVVYNGQRGYIFKNFIRRSPAEEAAAGGGLF